jgi:hypothetical protein
MDVMIIKDDTSVESVVTNFDLTICQVWYDGISVHASHWADIRSKHGSLQPEYHKSYMSGNRFIHQRIRKYSMRGFEIDTPDWVEPEKAQLFEELEDKNNVYREYLKKLRGVKPFSKEEYAIQDKINENTYETVELYERLYTKKTISPDNIEKWVVIKIYDMMILDNKYYTITDPVFKTRGLALLLSYPMYPITFDRLREITDALHLDVLELFNKTFLESVLNGYPFPPLFDDIIKEKQPLFIKRLYTGKRRKTRKQKNRRNTSRTKPRRKMSRRKQPKRKSQRLFHKKP